MYGLNDFVIFMGIFTTRLRRVGFYLCVFVFFVGAVLIVFGILRGGRRIRFVMGILLI